MDLSRRLAAGELSELFGTVALGQDRIARLFRFRSVARTVLEQASPEQRAVMDAYAQGVNAGLAALSARPWEYWLLGQRPAQWRGEDSILVVYAMWWDLQASGLRRAILRREVNERLGGPQCEDGWKCALSFFYPPGTGWDAPAGVAPGNVAAQVTIPGPQVLNVRAAPVSHEPTRPLSVPVVGSNNWAVGGALTTTGVGAGGQRHAPGPARANHLVPRAPAKVTGAQSLDLNGVTLPGAPLLVAGSNGHIAWGFTNSYGDWLDVSRVECTAVTTQEMDTPSGPVPLHSVARGDPGEGRADRNAGCAVRRAGGTGAHGACRHTPAGSAPGWRSCPEATNMNLMLLEHATTVDAGAGPCARRSASRTRTSWWATARATSAGPSSGASPRTQARIAHGARAPGPPRRTTRASSTRRLARLWTANARVASEPAPAGS